MPVPLIAGGLLALRIAAPKIISKVGPKVISAGSKLLRGAGRAVAPKTIKGAVALGVGAPVAVGVLGSSKKARGFIDPRENIKRGKKIGEIIEDPKSTEDILGIKDKKSAAEKVAKGLAVAGIVGAGAAGALAIKKRLEERRAAKAAEDLFAKQQAPRDLGFTDPQPVGLGGRPVQTPSVKTLSGAPEATQTSKMPLTIVQIQV